MEIPINQSSVTKPIMHVKIGYAGSYISGKKLAQTLKKYYSDRFDVIFTTYDMEIKVDNMLVLEINKDTDLDKLSEAIEKHYQSVNK